MVYIECIVHRKVDRARDEPITISGNTVQEANENYSNFRYNLDSERFEPPIFVRVYETKGENT